MRKQKDKGIKDKKTKKDPNEKILKNILFTISILILFVLGYYLYAQSQITLNYKDIEFKAASYGKGLIFYETQTLLPSRDGSKEDFGFRIRTKPTTLKKISFDSSKLNLMYVNGMKFEGGNFSCEGFTAIAIPNLERLFQKIGTTFVVDQNENCDPDGRYNFFIVKYGDKTQINNLGQNCYEVIVKGDDEYCEILPATEKIMVEVFSKYKEFIEN